MNQIEVIREVSDVMDALGVGVVSVGVLWGLIFFIKNLATQTADLAYKVFRVQIVRSLILGLEVLVAGDVIRTVAISPTLTSVAVLGAIVMIRCFLSWSLTLEIDGAVLGLQVVVDAGYRYPGQLVQLDLVDAVFLHHRVEQSWKQFLIHLDRRIALFCEFTSYKTDAGEVS